MDPATVELQQPVREAGLDYETFDRVEEAWAWFRDRVPRPARVRVVGDDDSDGVNSAFLLTQAFRRAGYEVETKVQAIHSTRDADQAMKGRTDAVVVADMGSSLFDHLATFETPVLILDHHRASQSTSPDVFEVNPRRAAAERVQHVSASVVSLLYAVAMDPRNWDLAASGVAGGLSDRQHLGGLRGLLGYAVEGGARAGVFTPSQGFTLGGQTVLEAVSDSLDPYFDGLAGDPNATRVFLEGLRVAPGENPLVLAPEAGRRLAQDLSSRLADKGVAPHRFYPLFGERLLLRHPSGAPTAFLLAHLLEAATSERAHELALRLLYGSPDARREAQTLAKHRTARLLEEVSRIRASAQTLARLRWAETRDPPNTGVYAHTLLTFAFVDDRPFAVVARTGGLAKVSVRGSPRLWESGLDLSAAVPRAAQAVGGVGGGHPGAAGATVPWGRRDEFLASLDAALLELGRRRP